MDIASQKCIALTTFRKSGEPVTTPVWVNPVSDGRIGFWTSMGSGKTKRMGNNPRVTVQPCSYSGKVKPGTTPVDGTAEMVQSGPLFDEVWAKGKKKYGAQVGLTKVMGRLMGQRKAGQEYGDTVVLIRLDA
ncbi:PPOX class F420-dependent oxidoreductase [Nocardioides montaniterrae]